MNLTEAELDAMIEKKVTERLAAAPTSNESRRARSDEALKTLTEALADVDNISELPAGKFKKVQTDAWSHFASDLFRRDFP
jgi:hypothetical protein